MHILIFNWRDPKNPKSGGAEIVTLEHAKAWIKKGHQVTWFTSSFSKASKEETIDGVNIIRRGNFLTVLFLAPLFYLFSQHQFDLVIDEIHGLPFFTPLYVRKPKIAFIHEVASEIWDYMYPFPINTLGKLLEPFYFWIYKDIKFWTDANSTVDELGKYGIKKTNCIVINCPINNQVVKKLPIKEEIPTFIFISRLVKMKGVEEVIKAFWYITKEEKQSKLWIVGEGEEKYIHQLKETVRKFNLSGKIKFFGPVSEKDKLNLLRRAHLLLHASVKEGWGLVVVEAASCATPAVVYNVSGLRDSVKNNITGVILKENEPSAMACEALLLLTDKTRYRKYQINGLKWAKSLTWEKATRESLKLL